VIDVRTRFLRIAVVACVGGLLGYALRAPLLSFILQPLLSGDWWAETIRVHARA